MTLSRKLLLSAAILASFAAAGAARAEDRPAGAPSGRVKIEQLQVAFIASGALGGGSLTYKGKTYPLKIAGLGVGGIGASRMRASGNVYGLQQLSDFPGAYAEIRTGWALGDRGKGKVWLRNAKGVAINLQGKRQGLQTALGAEGVVIDLK